MNTFVRAALLMSVAGLGACANLAHQTRDFVGLSDEPVRTEDEHDIETLSNMERTLRAQLLADMLVVARGTRTPTDATNADASYQLTLSHLPENVRTVFANLSDGRTSGEDDAQVRTISARDFAREAEAYHSFGRAAFRGRCELFLQTLASVDGQISYGRDLGNNIFDAATILSTAFDSPVGYAIGISTTQSTFNSVYGSMERYLMLTDSVGPLRERVVEAMEAVDTEELNFEPEQDPALLVNSARLGINHVQNYGAICSEAGLRQIIGDALRDNQPTLERELDGRRAALLRQEIEEVIGTLPGFENYNVSDPDLQLLYAFIVLDRTDAQRQLIGAGLPRRNDTPLLSALSNPNNREQLNSIIRAVTALSEIEPYKSTFRAGAETVRQQALLIPASAPAQPAGDPESDDSDSAPAPPPAPPGPSPLIP